MKKFLTVLLVIAVMFTFSFGSAFAAVDPVVDGSTPTTFNAAVAKAYETLAKELNKDYEAYLATLKGNYTISGLTYYANNTDLASSTTSPITTTVVAADVLKAAAAEKYEADMEALATARTANFGLTDVAGGISTTNKITYNSIAYSTYSALCDGIVAGYDTVASTVAFSNTAVADTSNKAFMKGLFAAAKASVLSKYALVKADTYSSDVICPDDPYKATHAGYVAKWVEEQTSLINATVLTAVELEAAARTTVVGYQDLISAKVQEVYGYLTYIQGTTGKMDTAGNYYQYELTGVTYACPCGGTHNLLTDDAAKDANTAKEIDKATALAAVNEKAAKFKSDAYKAHTTGASPITKAKYEAALAEADAFVEVWTEFINNGSWVKTDAVESYSFSSSTDYTAAGTKTYTNLVKVYKAAAKEAANLKLVVAVDGKIAYNPAVIDENLADAKTAIYNRIDGSPVAISNAAVTAYTGDLTAGADRPENLEWAKKNALAILAYEKEGDLYNADGTAKYYDVELAKAEAKFAAAEAKVNACTTVDQVTALAITKGTDNVRLTGIAVKADVNSLVSVLSGFSAEATKVENYVKELNGDLYSWDDKYIPFSAGDLAEFYAEKGARTTAEMKALLADAKAWAAAVPTVGAQKAEQAAVEDMIKALPTVPTLADKDAVKAAYEAAKDATLAPANDATLRNAIAIVQAAEEKAIDDMFKALPAVSKLTTANKAAVLAAAAAAEAFDDELMYTVDYSATTGAYDVDAYANAVRDAELADVIKAIATLPENATAEQIKAARAAYDTFVKDWTDELNDYNAADYVGNISRLEYAEETLVMDAEDAKAYVQDLGIKARSVKTTKGVKITIKADVQELLDNGYTVEYKFYRSTKSNKGFKAMVTKTTGTYTNTKGVKGTKYYYKAKLVVKNAAGEVVATTPLTQCLYATRTF